MARGLRSCCTRQAAIEELLLLPRHASAQRSSLAPLRRAFLASRCISSTPPNSRQLSVSPTPTCPSRSRTFLTTASRREASATRA
ncbi:hypothetical protein BCR35DRAFT_84381 [Leucosporidium creatinivorum]|uniref:Uncharacterized protein n=1 Tax=Leucosporidium creatinivorum TaxID=106004 RepID=A0A1Y2FCV7_9BASI|nr:hypothetical protein BCR35DRAFT_84381 [Leucosporidium creatinivorum]